MHQLLRYFRQHPWQRLAVTLPAAAALGLAVALIAKPIVTDMLLIRRMGSEDAVVRELAIIQAVIRGRESEATVRRLEGALDLDMDNDARFAALASALNQLGRFNTPDRDPRLIDKLGVIRLKTTARADSRLLVLDQIVRVAFTTDRRNEYISRACALAAGDGEPQIRARAALLAAIIKDDKTLQKLLEDEQGEVKAAAMLDAGLARREGLVEKFAPRLLASPEVEVASSAAYALHHRSAKGRRLILVEAHVGEDRRPQNCRIGEFRPRKVRANEHRAIQTRKRKIGIGEIGAREVGPVKIGIRQIGTLEVEHRQVEVSQIESRKISRQVTARLDQRLGDLARRHVGRTCR